MGRNESDNMLGSFYLEYISYYRNASGREVEDKKTLQIVQSKVTGLCLTIVRIVLVVVKNKTFATFTRLNVKLEMFAISDRYDR